MVVLPSAHHLGSGGGVSVGESPMSFLQGALFTVINALILVGNLCLLHTFIKLYTEVLKIEHVKRIGRRGK